MPRLKFILVMVLGLAIGGVTMGQSGPMQAEPADTEALAPDSIRIGFLDFLGQVLQYHPIAKQAQIKAESGQAYIQVARGAFDPYLAAAWDAKRYGGKDYWQLFEGGVKVPTWFGTEFYAGWSSAVGTNLDPSQSLPSAGQTALGVEVNLGRGLFIDQRRADLQKAKLYAQGTQSSNR
ncbi:MAG: TolC family protein [Bacteroidia bacterium]